MYMCVCLCVCVCGVCMFDVCAGIPRLINTLCERALIGAYGANLPLIKKDIVGNAAVEVLGKPSKSAINFNWLSASAVTTALLIFALGLWGALLTKNDQANSTVANAANGSVETQIREHVQPVINAMNLQSQAVTPVDQSRTNTIEVGLSSLLNGTLGKSNTSSAFANLFEMWERDYSAYSGKTACTKAMNAGMRCIFGQGTIEMLARYNRPAVIEMRDMRQELVYAVLRELKDNQVVLSILDTQINISVAELENNWTGNYVIFWKPPFPSNESLAKGFIGPDVLWLRHKLDQIEGQKQAEYSSENLHNGRNVIHYANMLYVRISK